MVGFPVHMSETPSSVKMLAPELGQHTEEVLLEFRYSWEEIGQFREEGVI
jgi:crotonobetainyl-CoA:carnitine CoA-transferase CaiB-like acyl-CoA transferase